MSAAQSIPGGLQIEPAPGVREIAGPPVASTPKKPALKVWSYEVPAEAKNKGFKYRMPAGARLLAVQRGTISAQLFALVNPEMPEEERLFYVAATNAPLPAPQPNYKALEYVGTWLGYGQTWHLFEVTRFDEPERFSSGREPGEEG